MSIAKIFRSQNLLQLRNSAIRQNTRLLTVRSDYPDVTVANESFAKRFHQSIWSSFVKDRHKPAIINVSDKSDVLTFGDLFLFIHSLASFLKSKNVGINRGDIHCTVLPNCSQFVIAFGASSLLGATISPASYSFTEFELQRQFNDTKCKIVFCHTTNLQNVLSAAENVESIELVIVVDNKENCPDEKNLISRSKSKAEVVWLNEVINTYPSLHYDFDKLHCQVEKDVLLMPYSSGTTGTPKGVMLTHRNFGTMMSIFSEVTKHGIHLQMDKTFNRENEVELAILPFYHIFGVGLLMNSLLNGQTCVTMSAFRPALYFEAIEKYKVRILFVVPPILGAIAKSPIVKNYDLSSVEMIISGAAAASESTCKEAFERLPNLKNVSQAYGMTELSLGSTFPIYETGKHRFKSAGKLMPNMELKIVDPDTKKGVGQHSKPGELHFRGPSVTIGYFNRPEATAETIDADNWLNSGDIGYIDKDGYIYIIDRSKELIKVKGFQVPPAELEEVLLSNKRIHDCAVVGIPHERYGETPRAFIIKADNTLNEQEVLDYVKERVSKYKQLTGGVVFVDEIPRNPSGKILRRVLKEKFK